MWEHHNTACMLCTLWSASCVAAFRHFYSKNGLGSIQCLLCIEALCRLCSGPLRLSHSLSQTTPHM